MAEGGDAMAQIFGGPLSLVETTINTHGIGQVISLINQEKMLATPPGLAAQNHLKLAMNDISNPQQGLVLPDTSHVAKMIEFVTSWDQQSPLLIHCWAGVSRSTAGVYIALCALNPTVSEEELAFALRVASPTATPNERLIVLADEVMQREGRMIEAVDLIGQGEMTFEGRVFSMPANFGPSKNGDK